MITEIPPLFFACCDDGDYHFNISKPFSADGYLWGTDARICVRQPIEDFSPELVTGIMYERGRLPRMLDMWKSNAPSKPGKLHRLPEAVWREPCPELASHEKMAYCEECDGEETVLTCDPVPIGDIYLISWAVGLLRHHGVSEVRIGKPHEPVTFTVGHVEGMLMPMDRERVRERLMKQANA